MLFRKTRLFALFFLLFPMAFALNAPVATSDSHPADQWAPPPIFFKWAAVGGAEKYCYILDSSADTPAPDSPCTALTNVEVPRKLESGGYYFHIKSVSGGASSGTTTYPIKLDVAGPPRSVLSAVQNPDSTIGLSWTEAVDDASGTKAYEIYRCNLHDFGIYDEGVSLEAKVTGLSFNDSNHLVPGYAYYYIIRPFDNAGNFGPVSNEARAVTAAKCDLEISFSINLSDDKKELLLSIAALDKISHGGLKALLPDGTEYPFFVEKEAFSDWNSEFDLSQTKEGAIRFFLSAKEFLGDNCDQNKEFIYDVTKPSVQFTSPKYNERVGEAVLLQVKAADQGDFKSGIKSVDFFVDENNNWEGIGSGEKKENDLFELQWDSFSASNGSAKFKAVVVDNTGNSIEATHSLFVLNAFRQTVDVNGAIAAADEKRRAVQRMLDDFSAKGISSNALNALVAEADASLNNAKELASTPGSNETIIKSSAAEAIALYESAEKVVVVSIFKTADFVFNKEQADILLAAAGITGQTAVEAKQFIEKSDPKRQLQVLLVKDTNSTYYKATVLVSYSVDLNLIQDRNGSDQLVKLIEIVPKEFAEYASELVSGVGFTILRDDPSIQFVLTKDQYRKKAVTYALKLDLSEQQANKLIEENVINKFIAPPILLSLGAAPGFSLPITTELILFISIAAIVVVIIILALLILRKKKSKAPLDVFGKK